LQPADDAIAEPPRATWSEAIAERTATEVVAVGGDQRRRFCGQRAHLSNRTS
jgi:hypothetical protein